MRGKGYAVLSRGWPDFILIKRELQPLVVEVKTTKDYLKPEQLIVLTLLSDYGFDVRISNRFDDIGRVLTTGELDKGHRLIWREGHIHNLQRRYPTEPIGFPNSSVNGQPAYSMMRLASHLGFSIKKTIKELVLSEGISYQDIAITQKAMQRYLARK